MKKALYSAMAVAMLAMTSCQDDMSNSFVGDEATVEFRISTPEISTRAYSDGKTVDHLHYAVYEKTGDYSYTITQVVANTAETVKPFKNLSTDVKLRLKTGKNYQVVFWADADGAPYSVEFGQKGATMTIDYDSEEIKCNNERLDAFFASEAVTLTGDATLNIELKRPFAQLNIGTDDYAESAAVNYTPKYSKVMVSELASSLNLINGEVGEVVRDVTFDYGAIPGVDEQGKPLETFPIGNNNQYLAMNYLLVNGKTVVDIEFKHNEDGENDVLVNHLKVNNVPIQRNYRTNIFGSLLTNSANANVTITPGYDGTLVTTAPDLKAAVAEGGTIILGDDITIENTIDVKAGKEVMLDMNGQTIIVNPDELVNNSNGSDYAFIVREGGKLTITGNGTVEATTPAPIIFYPAGDLVIENGKFIRNIPDGYTGNVSNMFVGTKPAGGWHATGVTIKGGYFDGGYYPSVLKNVDIDKLITGEVTLEETETDIKKRGQPGDTNVTRNAIKDLVSIMFNKSNNYFKVYGGTFVGASPAWGDEGCMLPTTPQYVRPWSYYQGAFLDGQTFHEDGIVLPEGYTITKGTHEDGRPTYTVKYNTDPTAP